MLMLRRPLETKLCLTPKPTPELRGGVQRKQATDYTNSSFLLQGGGVLRAKKITGYTPKASHSGRTELAGRAFVAFNLHRIGCFDTFDCLRPWRSTRIPP